MHAAALAASAILTLTSPAELRAQGVDTLEIRAHTRFLADDALLGRGAGSPGENIAAAYIEAQLMRLGLRPVGTGDSFLQPLPLRRISLDPQAMLILAGDTLIAERDFTLNLGAPAAFRPFAGTAWFVGESIQARTAFAAGDRLDGRVAIVAGYMGLEAAELLEEWRGRGLEGVILLIPEADEYRRIADARGTGRYAVDADLRDPVWQPELPVLVAGPAAMDALLAGVRLPDAFFERAPIPAIELRVAVDAQLRVHSEALRSFNVAGMLPGSDPARAGEAVIVTAHLDHLGVGPPDERGDSIYNGFSDNAAGVAMLLAIAEAMRAEPPARSVIFLFLAAEERGLLGSGYYAAAPLFPLEQTRAVINLDAGAPPAPPVSWRIAGAPDLALAERAARVAEGEGWSATVGPARANSDHWPFAQRGVPAAFIIPGGDWEDVSTADKAALQLRWERYHQPGDEYHPDFPFRGLGRYADFAMKVLRAEAER
jgi:hypothetical protein